jgi:hypothetical protein
MVFLWREDTTYAVMLSSRIDGGGRNTTMADGNGAEFLELPNFSLPRI